MVIAVIDDTVLNFNRLGIIPGPEENLDEFLYRAHYCLNLKETFNSKLLESAPFNEKNQAPEQIIEESFSITENLYDIKPQWIPIFFSNYKLAFWHGGCAWIFQENEQTPVGAFFQLRTSFKYNPSYLGLYKRNLLMAHEFSHVGRMMFEEPRFEEVFAYRSDKSRFRRYFGPIMQSSWESALFVLFLFVIIMVDFSLSLIASAKLYEHFMWLKLIPVGMILFALGRLIRKQRQFSRCFKKLNQIVDSEQNVNGIIYRLTDQEISSFAKMTTEQLINYIEINKDKTLRWQVISAAYLISKQRQ